MLLTWAGRIGLVLIPYGTAKRWNLYFKTSKAVNRNIWYWLMKPAVSLFDTCKINTLPKLYFKEEALAKLNTN